MRRRENTEKGAALAELAILLPVALAALVGSVDLGRAGYEAIAVANAARSGAAYGSFSPDRATDIAGMEAAATDDLSKSLPEGSFTVRASRYCTCGDGTLIACDAPFGVCDVSTLGRRMYVRVRVTKTFNTLLAYPGLPSSIALEREAHMRAE